MQSLISTQFRLGHICGRDDILLVRPLSFIDKYTHLSRLRPNVGGPVGLASIYVDPALGFALGTCTSCLLVVHRTLIFERLERVVQLVRALDIRCPPRSVTDDQGP